MKVILIIFSSLISANICLPICHDNIPFSIKLSKSSLVIYGDIIQTSIPDSLNNSTQSFNITFHVKCTLKGIPPKNENIIIEHTPPDNPICYRTLINGSTYVYFLHQMNKGNFYKQMSYHELLFNEDTTIEILKRTCGIQVQPFHQIVNENQIDEQCPIVSIGCI